MLCGKSIIHFHVIFKANGFSVALISYIIEKNKCLHVENTTYLVKKIVPFVVITGEGVFIMNNTKAMRSGFWDKLFPPLA